MRLPKFRCKNKVGNWCFFTVLHNGNVNEENFNLETLSKFTGLLDKQGVEIYEGDIVKTSLGIFIIDFYFQAFALTDVNSNHICYMHEVCNTMGKIYEVIGNIYENPELLGV